MNNLIIIGRAVQAFALIAGMVAAPAMAEDPPSFLLTWGSLGTGQGQFDSPEGMGAHGSFVYVSDSGNHRIQKFDTNGNFVSEWGEVGSGPGQFLGPSGIDFDSTGNVYVADRYRHRIQKFDATGTFLTTWGSFGEVDPGQFSAPAGVAVGPDGSVYVADTGNNRIQKFTANGIFLLEWGSFCDYPGGGGCIGDGNGQFEIPFGIDVDQAGFVYVADGANHRIQKFDADGNYILQWGSLGSGDGQFTGCRGIDIDSAGDLYVVDIGNDRVQKFDSAGTFLTKWGTPGSGPGQFDRAIDVAVDGAGNIYVVDFRDHRVQKFGPVLTGIDPILRIPRLAWSPAQNPAIGAALLQLRVPRTGHVVVGIYDARGRLMHTAHAGTLPPGEHLISWDPSNPRIASGAYFAVARTPGARAVQRIVVLH